MIRTDKIFIDYADASGRLTVTGAYPVISWSVASEHCGGMSAKYRVRLVMNDGGVTLYDTGFVSSCEQRYRHTACALPRGEVIQVFVTVTDTEGREGICAHPALIINGECDFSPTWITSAEPNRRRAVYFKKEFYVRKDMRDAVLYVCGLGYHNVDIDGYDITDRLLSPLHSDYGKICYYSVLPVGGLEEGAHTLNITVGDGWRHLDSRFVERNTPGRRISMDGCITLGAILRLKYLDGEEEEIATGPDWLYAYGSITSSNLFDGEDYDARIVTRGEDYRAVGVCEAPCELMKPMTLEPIRANKAYNAVSIFSPSPGAYVIDFGRNMAGFAPLPLYAGMEAGQRVFVRYAEMLDEDGSLYTAPLREARCTDTYTASGNESDEEYYQPLFTYHGFRYIQLEGYGKYPEIDKFFARSVYTDIDKGSYFTCGCPLVNRIHENALATERSNIHGVLTDCPQRDERMGWLNDATVRFEAVPYSFDIGRLFPKIVRDILLEQSPDGAITCTAPFIYGQRPADPVCSSFLIAAHEAYMHTGNDDILREGFFGFEAWQRLLLSRSDDYIVNYSYYGDWAAAAYACVSDESAVSAQTPGILMSTGYSYLNCRLLCKFASALGMADKAEYYASVASNIRHAFNSKWLERETGIVASGSQGALAFALWLGILPEECRHLTARALRDDLVSKNYMFTTGNLTTRYMFDMLAEYGYTDDAWRLLTKVGYPSYEYMINNEATTMWERFELKKNPDMNSHNHPMYGAVDYFLYAYILGVRPTEPGYRRVSIKPRLPEGLLSCSGNVATVMGDISVRWVRRFGHSSLYITIPHGVWADVEFEGEKRELASGSHRITVPCEV